MQLTPIKHNQELSKDFAPCPKSVSRDMTHDTKSTISLLLTYVGLWTLNSYGEALLGYCLYVCPGHTTLIVGQYLQLTK